MLRPMFVEPPLVAVLDDEPEMRKALRRLLTSRGYRVEEYERGEDLLAVIGSRAIDYLLLDLHMPGLNGFELLEEFQARQIQLAVLVITAHDEPGTEDRVRALNACAYLKKPVDRDALLSALQSAKVTAKKP